MSFDSIEQSVQSATPAELYDFVSPTTTWRITTYDKDLTYGGHVYTATAGSRSNLATGDVQDNPTDVTVHVPANHIIAQTYVNGVPPRDLYVTITRYHPSSGVFLEMWQGYASNVTFAPGRSGGKFAAFQVPNLLVMAMGCEIPSVLASRVCNNFLFDGRCQVAQASFQVSTTITAISADGTTITTAASVPAAVGGVDWALHGALQHTVSGESRTIFSQLALNQVQLQAPFPNGAASIGDAVLVLAGCDHTQPQCVAKFSNAINFGGHPLLPNSNVFYVGLVAAIYQV